MAADASEMPNEGVVVDGRPVVLVCEDNPETLRLIVGMLGNRYRILTAASGAEALATPPDLVVTDLIMPRLGGDQLITEMRARKAPGARYRCWWCPPTPMTNYG